MAFELESGEGVGAGIRRIVDEQLANAHDELHQATPRKADEAVHSARKRLKRIRAVTRLVRDELGQGRFKQENAAFRDTGRTLSEARDAAVLVQTLDALKSDIPDAAAFAAARKLLVARRKSISRRVLKRGNGLDNVADAVGEARNRVTDWPIDHDGWRALHPGLRRVYADGRRCYKLAEVGAAPELFHEWRKQVKNLWHQLEILEPVWPAMIKELGDECHNLADALGRDHDLVVLCEVLKTEMPSAKDDSSAVLDAAQSTRTRLQREALSLGARIYAEKPKRFTRRIGQYWRAWRKQGAPDIEEEKSPSPTPAKDAAPAAPAAHGVQGGGGGTEAAAGTAAVTATGRVPSGNGAS